MKTFDYRRLTNRQTKRLNKMAIDYATKIIDTVSEEKHDDPFWWITPLYCRSVYISDAFYYVCLTLLAIEEIKAGYNEIIVPSNGVKKSLVNSVGSKLNRSAELATTYKY